MIKIPCTYMRGGTAKGIIFKKQDLPKDKSLWNNIFLKVMGNGNSKQIDGLGGLSIFNNKIILVEKSDKEDIDIEYTAIQVIPSKNKIDDSINCGNMTSAVAPFAVDDGMVVTKDGIVRMLNTNSNKVINAKIKLKDGKYDPYGDYSIIGVEGTSSEITLSFIDPKGSMSDKLLPTGNVIDKISTDSFGDIDVSIVDASSLTILVDFNSIGLKGNESIKEIEASVDTLEEIRGKVASLLGLVQNWKDAKEQSPATPKLALVTKSNKADVKMAVFSVGSIHKSSPITTVVAVSSSCIINNSISNKYKVSKTNTITLEHPTGVIVTECKSNDEEIEYVTISRTSRRIMDGSIYIYD